MFHGSQIYNTDQRLFDNRSSADVSHEGLRGQFRRFIHEFQREGSRIYHAQLLSHSNDSKYYITVDLIDLRLFDEQLFERFLAEPLDGLSLMEQALTQYAEECGRNPGTLDKWQVMLVSDQIPRRLRDVNSSLVSKLFSVQGIVVTTSKPFLKASVLRIQCKSCGHVKDLPLAPGQTPYIPRRCMVSTNENPCEMDPYMVMPDSEVIDAQQIKIQELPEEVPTGQTPRASPLFADRYNVGRCVPGDKVKVTGIMMVQKLKSNFDNLTASYMYITGIEKLSERNLAYYTTAEEEVFRKLSKDPQIYKKISESVAPGIYGNNDIKKAIACLLFGGSRKRLPDNTKLRGDLNVLLIGDPSTAKSQFLKFVEQTASIAIYTSGKGSSAAGLTATVNKDVSTGEFQIEGGALVLADGGIVCIDEFDKMKPADRVAIHEAMEQQTISVAKAGITTRLNSRTSVLAAANPIFGSWSTTEEISEQVQLQTTILSRFDCIFIVKDINTEENNKRIVDHILDLHTGKATSNKAANVYDDLPFDMMKKYISYARSKCAPKLGAEAAQKVQNFYLADRQKSKEYKKETNAKNSMPITVRQLEAVIRLSEALAKMRLRDQVTVDLVDEAHRLFEVSTLKSMQAKEMGIELPQNLSLEVSKVEEAIKKRVNIGNMVPVKKIMEEMDHKYSNTLLQYAIESLTRNGDFVAKKGRKFIYREK